jgi:hypothetical protein
MICTKWTTTICTSSSLSNASRPLPTRVAIFSAASMMSASRSASRLTGRQPRAGRGPGSEASSR